MPTTQNRNTLFVLLRRGSWFGSLPSGLQRQIVEASRLHRFEPHAGIADQGQPVAGLWAILQGQVLISETFADGTEFLVQIGGPGYWFEFASALNRQVAMTQVTANSQVRAMLLPMAALERILQEDPTAYRYFAEPVLERYRLLLRLFAQSRTMDPERFFQVRLAALVNRWRDDGYREPIIEIELSQAAAARMLGLSRQTFNRYLSRLEEDGVIETSFRSIRILQPDLLCAKAAAL
jgi:CRP/FNR family transcriptional regulator, cyclic AMP receptor protein